MSTDRLGSAAIRARTKADVLYFEVVELVYQKQRVFLGVGGHSLFLLYRDLRDLYPHPAAGAVPYAHIDRLLEDSRSTCGLSIVLNEGRHEVWQNPNLLIITEHRERLVNYLKVAWQTDRTARFAGISDLPCITTELRDLESDLARDITIRPFAGHQAFTYEGYSIFIRESYEDVTSGMHSASSAVLIDKSRGLTLKMQISEPEPLSQLHRGGRGHVRWVAGRYLHSASETQSKVAVIRSAFYHKRMNLANDIACWTAWELVTQSDSLLRASVFMRRSYVPPLMDGAQDVFVTIDCPRRAADDLEGTMEALLREARCAADSVSPLVRSCLNPQTMYRDMVQAKLDALLFDEDAMAYLHNALGLQPEAKLQLEARCFVKSILKLFQEESALAQLDLLVEIGEDIPTEKEPMLAVTRMRSFGAGPGGEEEPQRMNSWCARLARYLAYCLDGVLLGSKFTIVDLCNTFIATHRSRQRVEEVILFLLHVRPKDYTMEFISEPIRHLMYDPQVFVVNTFSDRVMQALLELGWIAKALERTGPATEEERGDEMSLDYANFLQRLLVSEEASVNLKAAVCRQLIEAAEPACEHAGILIPPLLSTARHPSAHLKTYAMATLAGMVAVKASVQDNVMSMGVIELCQFNLRSSDDDLVRYTLVLLGHISKSPHHRQQMRRVAELLMDVLERTLPGKEAVLVELANVIGQLCSDDALWLAMCEHSGLTKKDESKRIARLTAIFAKANKNPGHAAASAMALVLPPPLPPPAASASMSRAASPTTR